MDQGYETGSRRVKIDRVPGCGRKNRGRTDTSGQGKRNIPKGRIFQIIFPGNTVAISARDTTHTTPHTRGAIYIYAASTTTPNFFDDSPPPPFPRQRVESPKDAAAAASSSSSPPMEEGTVFEMGGLLLPEKLSSVDLSTR
jgi:hypothetical protein